MRGVSEPAWISFDCYGTLVDWNRGITATMESIAPGRGAELRALYERVEPEVQAERPFLRSREMGPRRLQLVRRHLSRAPAGAAVGLGRSRPRLGGPGDRLRRRPRPGDPAGGGCRASGAEEISLILSAFLRGILVVSVINMPDSMFDNFAGGRDKKHPPLTVIDE